MKLAHLKGYICTGHGCWPPRNNIQGSPNVFVNAIPWHRQGDGWSVHCCPCSPPCCHSSVLAAGSSTVYVNGKQAARVGDPVACGSRCLQGNTVRVYAGD